MKKIKLTDEQAKSIYDQTSDAGVKELLIANFGEMLFRKRPIGVWCLTDDGRAITPEQWSGNNKCIGIGVVSEKTEYIVSLHPSVSLPMGDPDVKDYPAIVYDETSYDNEAATTAFIEAQAEHARSEIYMYNDRKYPYTGCPAMRYVRQDNTGNLTWSLPTVSTLKDIQQHLENINKALVLVGGYIIPCGCHYSATFKKDYKSGAFVVYLGSGVVGSDFVSIDNCVRSVSAFHLENFKF